MKIRTSMVLFALSFVLMLFAAMNFAEATDAGVNVAAVADLDAGASAAAAEAMTGAAAGRVVDAGKDAVAYYKNGEIALMVGAILMVIGGIGRKLASRKWDFWGTKTGGYTIAAIAGVAALGAGVIDANGFNVDVVVAALIATFTAMATSGPMKKIAAGIIKATKGA